MNKIRFNLKLIEIGTNTENFGKIPLMYAAIETQYYYHQKLNSMQILMHNI